MKKLLLIVGALAIAIAVVPLFAAYEAHVINVTAHIENALWVNPEPIEFGTVFPQEDLERIVFIRFSDSFCQETQTRVGIVDYKIVQKPKPRIPMHAQCQLGSNATLDEHRKHCHEHPEDLYCCYPSLCPYLSKTEDKFPIDNDTSVLAFHDPGVEALGRLEKFAAPFPDMGDYWTIDLAVPCFEGHCAQDWASFVTSKNPDADPAEFVLPANMEHEVFGCDLWFEVTGISEPAD